MLKIYNTLTQQKQEVWPIKTKQVKIYVCGVTVYDHCHLGHARVYLFFDSLIRYLQYLGIKVIYARNITDIDDKILAKAKKLKIDPQTLATEFTRSMHQDFAKLNLLPPTFEPKATDYIAEMIKLIANLLAKQHAYVGKNGDLFYAVHKFADYGQLAKRDLEDDQQYNRSTGRTDLKVQQAKHTKEDFVLWKLVPTEEVGWISPWGYGRPGWHTECAAMMLALFNNKVDLHGGGFDLIFPHHENELAQCEAIMEHQVVKAWMHVGFLQFAEQKMSKSLGNFTLIKDLLATTHPEVLRYFVLSAHYRSQVEFSQEKIQAATRSLETLYLAIRGVTVKNLAGGADHLTNKLKHYQQQFCAALNDDLNTPVALAVLFEIAKEVNIGKALGEKADPEQQLMMANLAGLLITLARSIGLLMVTPAEFLQAEVGGVDPEYSKEFIAKIENLIAQRDEARMQKNWKLADHFRQQLLDQGILLEDQGTITSWRRKS